jgi:hypothetical protein
MAVAKRKVVGRGPGGVLHYAPVKPKKPIRPVAPAPAGVDPFAALAPLTQAQIQSRAKADAYGPADAQITALTTLPSPYSFSISPSSFGAICESVSASAPPSPPSIVSPALPWHPSVSGPSMVLRGA